jgi:hypothetical protein
MLLLMLLLLLLLLDQSIVRIQLPPTEWRAV